MPAELPLPTLLSQALVAFTEELDNEFEHRMPHRTAKGGSRHDPWLTSVVMWSNCLRFVGEEGVTARALEGRAGTKTNLDGMRRWGYVTIQPDPADPRPKPPESAWLIRLTPGGRKADAVWWPLFGVIETRWQQRFGAERVAGLGAALASLNDELDPALPDCLPILGYGMFSRVSQVPPDAAGGRTPGQGEPVSLLALLSRVLLAYAIDFESGAAVSLAISANLLRVLHEDGVRVRDLPRLSGVSKEALSMAMGVVQKRGLVVLEPESADSRVKVARLTPDGRAARDAYLRRIEILDERWRTRFGTGPIAAVRASLEPLVGEGSATTSPLFRGLEPYPDGWRASVVRPVTLPHYPMVLHRGGYPDGS